MSKRYSDGRIDTALFIVSLAVFFITFLRTDDNVTSSLAGLASFVFLSAAYTSAARAAGWPKLRLNDLWGGILSLWP